MQSTDWFVVKVATGHCQVMPVPAAETIETVERWGPYASQGEAIARRVGLIRAGKCQPQ
jgi:hypothetical protein